MLLTASKELDKKNPGRMENFGGKFAR